MKRILSLLLLCLTVTTLMAIPARRGTFTAKQSDGTTLTLKMVGDEHLHYFVNVATNEKMYRGADGDFHALDEATLTTMETKANARRAEVNAQRVKRLQRRTGVSTNGARRVGSVSGGMTGTKKGLVILVNFSDKTMATAHTQSAFDNQFNEEGYSEGGHLGSVHDFFYDQSYGQFDLDFDVVGPVTVSNKMSYYGGNDSSGNDKYPATMVIEALKLVDSEVDFSDYDWDGDGEVDQVYVIYAGYGEAYGASSSTIWPHEWQLSSAKQYSDGSGAQTLDGVTIDTYACSCELSGTSGSTLNGIGTACHEFSHCLGFPDFYDTSYAGGFGMNSWDLMDAGSYNGPGGCGEVPAGYTSYERWCAGWLTPTELTDPKTVTGMKSLFDSPEAYIIYNDKNSDEYILLENRQNTKWFKYVDTYTTPHGLLAIHVDYDETAWTNDEPNNTASHQRMSIIPASGTYGTKVTSSGSTYYTCTEAQLKGHPFGGSSSYTSLTGTSNSSSGGKWFTACSTGSTTLNHEVTEIANASDGTISFLFDGGAAEDDGSRYTVTLNAGTGTCATASWTQTDFQESMTLPTAVSPSEDWTFIGWSTTEYAKESSTPPTVYASGSSYQPTADATLYAIYKKTTSGSGASGSYTLDYSAESSLQSKTLGYGNAVSYTATDGSTWVIKAYKNNGLQINKGKSASIKVPECPGNISTIEVTDATAKVLSFSATDYTGSNTPTAAATSSSSTSATLDLSSANLTTGYIYTTDGSTVITKIVVNYGAGDASTYWTYPEDEGLTTPTIAFADPADQSKYVGDTYTNAATVTGSTGTVTYTSSNTSVATIDNNGQVTALTVGTTTITATVAKVDGVSNSATTSYTLTVTMPALASIAVTTQPTTTIYMEGDNFSKEGMVVTATYANGYTQPVTTYTCEPSTSVVLETTDTEIKISYTEGSVTATTTVPITVNALVVPNLSFAESTKSVLLGDEAFTNVATCTNSTGAITYKSSDTKVVTVNSTTGAVTIVGTGSATITATIAAVDGVSKSGTATYTITVGMPTLTGIAIATPATNTTFNAGGTFSASGLTLTATYANGYEQTITSGYTTSITSSTTLTAGTQTVTVSYTEGDVTKTVTYDITVNELPRYAVTFTIIGKAKNSVTEASYQAGVTAPTVADVTTTIDDAEVTYTFAGWSTTDITEETTTKPTFVTLTNGKYMPSANTTLYAVYTRTSGDGGSTDSGFTLNLTYKGTQYYCGSASSSGSRILSSEDSGMTLYYEYGYLWYLSTSGNATYIYSSSSSKTDLKFTTTKSNVSNTWTMTEVGDSVNFYCKNTSRWLALNGTSPTYIRAYKESTNTGQDYPHNWKMSGGSTTYYTGYPISTTDITKDGRWSIADLAALIDILNGNEDAEKYDLNAADVNSDGEITSDDIEPLTNLLLGK